MKKFVSIFAIFSILLVFNACGDSRPEGLPVSRDATASKSFTLIAAAGNSAQGRVTFNTNDFTAIKEYIKWIESIEAQASSYIQISGITSAQEVELREVKLSLERDSKKNVSLGTVTANDKLEATNVARLGFMQAIMDEVNRRGACTVVLDYRSTHNLTAPVTLTIAINSRFNFDN